MTTVSTRGRRFLRVAIAGAFTFSVAASIWLLASRLEGSSLQTEGTLFGDAGHEKKGVGSLHTREEPARLSSKTLEVVATPRTHFRTATDLPVLTVELYRGTLLTRGEVSLVIGETTATVDLPMRSLGAPCALFTVPARQVSVEATTGVATWSVIGADVQCVP